MAQDSTSSDPTDRQSLVMNMPGLPEGSIFSVFPEQENVSLYSGSLVVEHPATPVFPLNGGGAFGLVRVYNSKNHDGTVHPGFCEDGSAMPEPPSRTWAGQGWTLHLGRYFTKSFFNQCSGPQDCANCSVADYGLHRRYVEDEKGTQYCVSEGFGSGCGPCLESPPARPRLRVRFLKEQAEEECPDGVDGCLFDPGRPGPRYEVTFEDGRQWLLKKIVPSQEQSNRYLRDSGRTGWYTVRQTDTDGNQIDIEYWGNNHPFPEAIKEIIFQNQGEEIRIWTDLYDEADVAAHVTAPENLGRLKRLHWRAGTGVLYQSEYAYDGGGYLVSATLPHAASEPAAGSLGYEYQTEYTPGSWDSTRLTAILYPTGGVTEYEYGVDRVGEEKCPEFYNFRLCPGRYAEEEFPLCCDMRPFEPNNFCELECKFNDRRYRAFSGVRRRSVYPEGRAASGGMPVIRWEWNRRQVHEVNTDTDWGPYTNSFSVRYPDGHREESAFEPMAKWEWVLAHNEWVYETGEGSSELWRQNFQVDKDTNATAVRREDFLEYRFGDAHPQGYIYGRGVQPLLTKTRTTFLDDQGSCFTADPPSSPPRTQTVEKGEYTRWDEPRLVTTSGDYLAGFRREYKGLEDAGNLLTLGQERQARWLFGAFEASHVLENGRRLETNAEFDGTARLVRQRSKNEYLAVSPPEPLNPANAAADADDPTVQYFYDGGGNLERVLDQNLSLTYETKYGYSFGKPVWVKFGTLEIKFRDGEANPFGQLVLSRDPHQRRTALSYDALGRLTNIEPLDSPEYPTRISYPDFNTIRIITSNGQEAAHDPNNRQQVFAEQILDGLGRIKERRKSLDDHRLAVQILRYDPMGRVVFQSEWMLATDYAAAPKKTWYDRTGEYWIEVPLTGPEPEGRPWGQVTFFGDPDNETDPNPLRITADPFGRPHRILAADGARKDIRYCGLHREETVWGVVTGFDNSQSPLRTPAVTRYYFDGMGRLALVDGPPEGADAAYWYDPRGKITKVKLVAQLPSQPFEQWKTGEIAGDGQVRTFEFDGLGRLVRSDLPERGDGSAGEPGFPRRRDRLTPALPFALPCGSSSRVALRCIMFTVN